MALADIKGFRVEPVAAPPRRTGLLLMDDVVVQQPSAAHWSLGTERDNDQRRVVRVVADLGSTASKTFTAYTPGVEQGQAFYVYAAEKVGLLDGTPEERKRTLVASVEANETVAVEQAVRDLVLTGASGATVLTPTAVSLRDGVAALEEALAANYGGLPMLHVDPRRAMVALAAYESLLVGDGSGRVHTGLGTPVAVGAGYVAGQGVTVGAVTAGAGEWWLFGTGWPRLRRSQVMATEAHDYDNNQASVLAERTYVAEIDSPLYAALVTEPA